MDALDMALGIGGDNAKAGSGRMANVSIVLLFFP
jgi:hypothetical protein